MAYHVGMKFCIFLTLIISFLFVAGCTQQLETESKIVTPAVTHPPSGQIASPTPDIQDLKREVAFLAAGYASEVDVRNVSLAINEGKNSTAFTAVLDQLKGFKAKDNRQVYVYILQQHNGSVRFVIDANYGLPDGSDFLSDYPDSAEELKKPVTEPIGAGPYTDQWGTFISGYAPVNISSDDTIILLGVDIRA